MKFEFPYIRSDSNFWLCGMGYAFFWYILFAVYCLHYQYKRYQLFKIRMKRLKTQDDSITIKPTLNFHTLHRMISIPYTTQMISIGYVLFVIFFSIVNLYFVFFFVPYEWAPYHIAIIDRRAAFIGMVNWGLVMFLAMRNSILTTLCGLSFEELLPFHRIISRIGVINFLPHLVYRMWYAYDESHSYFNMFFKDIEYTTGTFAMWGGIAMCITALERIRRDHFEIFYYSHIIFGIITTLGTLFHYPTCFVFFLPPTFLWLIDRLIRTSKSWQTLRTATHHSSDLLRVTIESNQFRHYHPGQYVFLAFLQGRFWDRFEWHPFTVSEVFHVYGTHEETPLRRGGTDGLDRTELRKRNGWGGDRHVATVHVKALGEKTKRAMKGSVIKMDGMYGPRLNFGDFRVLGLFATGIGITPALVVMKDVVGKRQRGLLICSTQKIYLVWAVKYLDEVQEFMDILLDCLEKCKEPLLNIDVDITVYITRSKSVTTDKQLKYVYGKRPNIHHHMNQIELENPDASVWAHACGPVLFTKTVVNEAVQHQFHYHHETFEF